LVGLFIKAPEAKVKETPSLIDFIYKELPLAGFLANVI
tara:strand:+ start:411 stop:524 length:114 start_codon:yes stop_codon:yes gene_type:complete